MTTARPLHPSAPADDDRSEWARRQPTDGSFDVAGIGGFMAPRAMQADPEIEHRFRETIRGMSGPAFTDKEITDLEDRALDALEMKDLTTLNGIAAGAPVYVTPLGDDDLGRRARESSQDAVNRGQVRTR